MNLSLQDQLIADLARQCVIQIAPDEKMLIRPISEAYFKNPERLTKSKTNNDPILGFGASEIVNLLTPAALAICGVVVNQVIQEIRNKVKSEITTPVIQGLFTKIDTKNARKKVIQETEFTYSQLSILRNRIATHFNIAEISLLCMDLGINVEELEGDTLSAKSQALVNYCLRRDSLLMLITNCQCLRPETNWEWHADKKYIPEHVIVNNYRLSSEQLIRIREIALEKARQMLLPEDKAHLMADSLIGSLVTSYSN